MPAKPENKPASNSQVPPWQARLRSKAPPPPVSPKETTPTTDANLFSILQRRRQLAENKNATAAVAADPAAKSKEISPKTGTMSNDLAAIMNRRRQKEELKPDELPPDPAMAKKVATESSPISPSGMSTEVLHILEKRRNTVADPPFGDKPLINNHTVPENETKVPFWAKKELGDAQHQQSKPLTTSHAMPENDKKVPFWAKKKLHETTTNNKTSSSSVNSEATNHNLETSHSVAENPESDANVTAITTNASLAAETTTAPQNDTVTARDDEPVLSSIAPSDVVEKANDATTSTTTAITTVVTDPTVTLDNDRTLAQDESVAVDPVVNQGPENAADALVNATISSVVTDAIVASIIDPTPTPEPALEDAPPPLAATSSSEEAKIEAKEDVAVEAMSVAKDPIVAPTETVQSSLNETPPINPPAPPDVETAADDAVKAADDGIITQQQDTSEQRTVADESSADNQGETKTGKETGAEEVKETVKEIVEGNANSEKVIEIMNETVKPADDEISGEVFAEEDHGAFAVKSAEELALEAVSEPVEASVPGPTEAAVPEPVEAAVPEPVEAAVSEPVEAAVPVPAEKAVPAPAEEAVSAPVQEAAPEAAVEVVPESAEAAVPEPAQEAPPEPAQEAPPEPARELIPEDVQKPSNNAAELSAEKVIESSMVVDSQVEEVDEESFPPQVSSEEDGLDARKEKAEQKSGKNEGEQVVDAKGSGEVHRMEDMDVQDHHENDNKAHEKDYDDISDNLGKEQDNLNAENNVARDRSLELGVDHEPQGGIEVDHLVTEALKQQVNAQQSDVILPEQNVDESLDMVGKMQREEEDDNGASYGSDDEPRNKSVGIKDDPENQAEALQQAVCETEEEGQDQSENHDEVEEVQSENHEEEEEEERLSEHHDEEEEEEEDQSENHHEGDEEDQPEIHDEEDFNKVQVKHQGKHYDEQENDEEHDYDVEVHPDETEDSGLEGEEDNDGVADVHDDDDDIDHEMELNPNRIRPQAAERYSIAKAIDAEGQSYADEEAREDCDDDIMRQQDWADADHSGNDEDEGWEDDDENHEEENKDEEWEDCDDDVEHQTQDEENGWEDCDDNVEQQNVDGDEEWGDDDNDIEQYPEEEDNNWEEDDIDIENQTTSVEGDWEDDGVDEQSPSDEEHFDDYDADVERPSTEEDDWEDFDEEGKEQRDKNIKQDDQDEEWEDYDEQSMEPRHGNIGKVKSDSNNKPDPESSFPNADKAYDPEAPPSHSVDMVVSPSFLAQQAPPDECLDIKRTNDQEGDLLNVATSSSTSGADHDEEEPEEAGEGEKEEKKIESKRSRKCCLIVAVLICIIIAIAAAVIGIMIVGGSDKAIAPETMSPSTAAPSSGEASGKSAETLFTTSFAPSESPTALSDVYYLLCPIVEDCEALLDETTPPGKALQWLEASSLLDTYSDEKRITRYALATLYYSTQGDLWHDKTNWLTDADECIWFSTANSTCTESNQLIALELDDNGLHGVLPFDVGLLTSLTSLNVKNSPASEHHLEGSFPSSIAALTNLRSLVLSGNSYNSTTVPSEIGQLVGIENLDLSFNGFMGEIPASFAGLSQLTSLNMAGNQLGGTIPDTIFSTAVNLVELNLEGNALTSLPSSIGSLQKLDTLRLRGNALKGFPLDVTLDLNLTVLDISENLLGGSIPTEIGNLVNLRKLLLNGNALTGNIPTEIGNLKELRRTLDLSNNSLIGTVPPELGNLVKLKELFLHQNQLYGTFPSEIAAISTIKTIRIDDNHLSGLMPTAICTLYDTLHPVSYCDCTEIITLCFTHCCRDGEGCKCRFEATDPMLCVGQGRR